MQAADGEGGGREKGREESGKALKHLLWEGRGKLSRARGDVAQPFSQMKRWGKRRPAGGSQANQDRSGL